MAARYEPLGLDDLIWKATEIGESLGASDETPVTFRALDNRGREHVLRFLIPNRLVQDGNAKQVLKRLKPVRRLHR